MKVSKQGILKTVFDDVGDETVKNGEFLNLIKDVDELKRKQENMPQTPEAAELQAITDKTLNEALEIILKVKREAVKSREKAIEAKEVALQLRETLINALEKLYKPFWKKWSFYSWLWMYACLLSLFLVISL